MGFSFSSIGKGLKKLWKGVENVGHKVGIDKDHLQSAIPAVTSLFNPELGKWVGAAMNGMDGVKSALIGEAIGGLANSSGLINLKNSNTIPQFTDTLKNVFTNPTKLLENIIISGGDVKKGLLYSLLQQNPTLSKYSNLITGALKDVTGIDLSKFGLKDAASMYALVKYLKDSPPEPPEVTYQQMTPEVIDKLYNNYSDIMDERNKVALQNVRDQFNARGLYRSGMELAQERKTQEDTNRALANYKANLEQQALQYNNELARQKYMNDLERYNIQAKLDADKKNALVNLISGNSGSGVLSGLFPQQGNENLISTIGSILNPQTDTQITNPTDTTGIEPSINVDNDFINNTQDWLNNNETGSNINIPDINLSDNLNNNLSPLRQNLLNRYKIYRKRY